jgi:hypothetical protein
MGTQLQAFPILGAEICQKRIRNAEQKEGEEELIIAVKEVRLAIICRRNCWYRPE